MSSEHIGQISFSKDGSILSAQFKAMANPCSIYYEQGDNAPEDFYPIAQKIAEEAWRIEQKYSRYIKDSILSKINNSKNSAVTVDPETFHLLTLSDTLWRESGGKFDISSGILRKLWMFNQQSELPSKSSIQKILDYIGWDKVTFNQDEITLPEGMEIDFGGIGKEYATDRCADIGAQLSPNRLLVNLGGDIAVRGKEDTQSSWQISIESKEGNGKIWKTFCINSGAVATSGDVYKSFIVNGKRYGHIINALTGYPIEHAPRTVTVAAPNCTEAGILSTLAILQGDECEAFLKEVGRPYWLQF